MGEKGVRGKGGKEEKPDPHRQGHAVFFLRPALALSFVDSGSGMGLKLGSRAMRLASGTAASTQEPMRQSAAHRICYNMTQFSQKGFT